DESVINRRRSGVRGTPAKVNANAGLAASEGVNSGSISDGSHESVGFRPLPQTTPDRGGGAVVSVPVSHARIHVFVVRQKLTVSRRPFLDALKAASAIR
ncbi:hypothetical protein, partial [Sphingomonas sp. S-NIH.Pt1_0416]|uniref:hypothetical protein n=1 Tax=Sphingomonas sp. S-NIH.Pt1_0416 TaxID=1920123 RepID=UPI0019D0A076